ncbi:PIG-L deacetylase family protein [Homoserinimonas sp. OAct 916]|uniref:PIG-L deacetylase family protein n=1 Tax=Homoserinimonas sp. OAct 916 TaxID=2211450 RepID=UPI000DBE4BB5|nr:PIG-L deacetylase family protein [Homoserinimonas sp. OAct 916]
MTLHESTAPGQPASIELFDDTDIRRILCVVAHPDDMEYGASAAVAEWTARGIEVDYVLLTAGEAGIRDQDPGEVGPLRAEEQRAACHLVGVSGLTILDLPDGLLEADLTTRAEIARQIRRVKPDAVLCTTWELETPWGLNHADHRATGLAVVDAIRDADNPWLFRSQRVDEGLDAWSTRWLLVTGTTPTHGVELSERSVELGIASLEAHEVYLAALPDHIPPRELITQVTRGGGEAAGVDFALGVRAIRMG